MRGGQKTNADREEERRSAKCVCGRRQSLLRRVQHDEFGRRHVMGGEAMVCTNPNCLLYTDVDDVKSWVPEAQAITIAT